MSKYYSLEKKEKKADLYIFGNISSYPWREKDKDAYTLVKELSELDATEVNVHINSTGGSVAEGLAIYNVLKNSEMKVTTYCDGFACSAASVIFMAGDERIMNTSSLLMIHNAWTYVQGNAKFLRKQADDLEKITQASIDAYLQKVNISEEEVKQMMDDETWISAKEAKEKGFATKIVEQKEEEVNQSAMCGICEKILKTEENKSAYPTVKEIAMAVVQEMTDKLKKEPKTNSWDEFFKTKE